MAVSKLANIRNVSFTTKCQALVVSDLMQSKQNAPNLLCKNYLVLDISYFSLSISVVKLQKISNENYTKILFQNRNEMAMFKELYDKFYFNAMTEFSEKYKNNDIKNNTITITLENGLYDKFEVFDSGDLIGMTVFIDCMIYMYVFCVVQSQQK